MTNSRSQPSNANALLAASSFLLVSVSLVGGVPVALSPLPAVALALVPAPTASSAPVANEGPASATTAAPGPAPTPTPAGAGLPAALVALLRDGTEGPFFANEVFKTPPAQALAPIEETVAAPEWYAITRGRFVGVVDQYALSTVAITGVAHGTRKAYTTQVLALDAFNRALTWGGVQVA